MRKRALFSLSLLCFILSFILLVMKIGFPYHRALACSMYVVSLVLLLFSLRHQADEVKKHGNLIKDSLLRNRRRTAVVIFFGAGAYLLWVLVPMERSPLLDLSDEQLRQHIENDRDLILTLDANLRAAYGEMTQQNLFSTRVAELTPELNGAIRDTWKRYVEAMFEFDILKEKYQGFAQIPYHSKPELHAGSFGIAFGSYVAQYRASLYLDRLVGSNLFMQSMLNEEDAGRGIPTGTYYLFQKRTVHPRTLLRYRAGVAYLRLIGNNVTRQEEILDQFDAAIRHIDQQLVAQPQRFIDKPLDILEQSAFESWLPVQKNIALGLSHIRAKERPNLIDRSLLEKIKSRLMPGDIMVQRRNWYATNLGIPGYWPHAALYIGTLAEMDQEFAGMQGLDGELPSTVLASNFPEIFQQLVQSNTDGDLPCVIEAIAPGVVLTSLPQSAGADSLAVLRPQVSLEDRWTAILRSLSYHGRPYDYNFDFATDSELVCSELVYKAYAGAAGLDLETVMLNGRPLLPPNHFVIKFDREYDLNPEARQLELVVFLDGRESEGKAVESDAAALRESWNRPKWYILQN